MSRFRIYLKLARYIRCRCSGWTPGYPFCLNCGGDKSGGA